MKAFKDCRYSAFISYCHDADDGHGGWVSQFTDELHTTLKARLRLPPGSVPPVHLSADNGPSAGLLGPELERNLADSFAMVIVVDECYLDSGWCLKELELFRRLFGEQGFAERLYVVAMSEPAMNALVAKPDWQRLAPPDLVWTPFFREDRPHRPVRVYHDQRDVLTARFEDQLDRLLTRLIASIRKPAPPPPPLPPAPRLQPGGALLFGVPAPEFAAATCEVAAELRQRGLTVTELEVDALQGDFAAFDTAQQLLLPIGRGGTALGGFRFMPGGHLALQRAAWLDRRGSEQGLLWLDLRDLPCATAPGLGHAELLAEVAPLALSRQALLQRLAPAAPAPGEPADEPVDLVKIYIESNQHEVDVWEDLGDRIKARWRLMVDGSAPLTVPPLHVQARGLRMQQLDSERLDDADGVVLLWGNKTDQSLRAQIDKVERKLLRDPPPGIVAYLIPQREDPQRTLEANYWNVLRFQDSTSPAIDIVPPEAERLDKFLRRIINRKARFRPPAAALAARPAP